MQLPNADRAVVNPEKIAEYLLDQEHPRGKHKARVFASACGITAEHEEMLREKILDAAHQGEAAVGLCDEHGQRFVIEWKLSGPGGDAEMVTAWIIRTGEDFPRFVTAYLR